MYCRNGNWWHWERQGPIILLTLLKKVCSKVFLSLAVAIAFSHTMAPSLANWGPCSRPPLPLSSKLYKELTPLLKGLVYYKDQSCLLI
jgi:hypothetical protein